MPVDTDRAIYQGAIPGMLRVLDPHSNFYDSRQFNLLREDQRGKYYGVGMSVAPRDGRTVVLAPFVGSPAYKAGIRPGDVIVKVDEKSAEGLSTAEVADLLKGAKGTIVRVTGGREGYFFGLDARSGALLWKFTVGAPVVSGPMSYSVNGKQYIAVAAGSSLFAFALRQ